MGSANAALTRSGAKGPLIQSGTKAPGDTESAPLRGFSGLLQGFYSFFFFFFLIYIYIDFII